MTPIRLTCKVDTPIVYSGDGMHLDSLLAYAVFYSLPEEEQVARHMPWEDGPELELPLARHHEHGEWVWCASAVYAEWLARTQIEVRRMTATDAMLRWSEDDVVNIGSGQFKGMDLRHEARWPSGAELTWYAVGDIDRIQELISTITGIGKLRNHGHGKINEDGWTVVEDNNARHLWRHRNMPAKSGAPTPLRPPYWCRNNFRPGIRVR